MRPQRAFIIPRSTPRDSFIDAVKFTASTSAFAVGLEALRTMRDGGYYGPDGMYYEYEDAYEDEYEEGY